MIKPPKFSLDAWKCILVWSYSLHISSFFFFTFITGASTYRRPSYTHPSLLLHPFLAHPISLQSQPPDSNFFPPQSCGLEKKAFPECSVAYAMTWLSFSLIPFRFPLARFYSYIKATVREKKGEAAVQTCFLERYLRFYCQDERH